ncbi:HD domain-containing protein [candidate division KSB1 bacterium]|nr:MAG: HD domain-containing protein [candidate division KSB1 bacterium]
MPITPETSPTLARVRELPAGDKITGFYLLAKLETKPKKDGTLYLTCRLQDASGALDAKMWEGFEDFLSVAKPGDVIKVEGMVDHYRDVPGLVISRIRLATSEEVPDRREFLPHSTLSRDDAAAQLNEIIATVKNEPLRNLLRAVFEDTELRDAFLNAPGGKMWHHATMGGLAEHTLSLARAGELIASHYAALNRDLIIAGALLHDIGKVQELRTDIAIDYSVDGRLIGHIVQGVFLVDKKMAELPDFPEETRRHVLHLILSHQGEPTMSSPVKPMTPEALVLHYLDEMDSKLNAFARIRAATPEGQDFSEYVRLMDRFFYVKSFEDDKTGTMSK